MVDPSRVRNGSVKPPSTLVNLSQTWSNLIKTLWTLGNVSRTTFYGFFGMVDPSRVRNGSVKPWSTLGQTWSTLGKLGRISGNVPRTPYWGYLSWRAFVGSGRLGSGCLILRADTRENPVGKNGVMTVLPLSIALSLDSPTNVYPSLKPWRKPSSGRRSVDTGKNLLLLKFFFTKLSSFSLILTPIWRSWCLFFCLEMWVVCVCGNTCVCACEHKFGVATNHWKFKVWLGTYV